MIHKGLFLGQPGTGKSTMGLSYPGVEQHVFGASEETTAKNFVGRKDILPIVKFDWYDTLKPEEKAKFTDEKCTELEVSQLTKLARARNIARYRRLIYQTKNDLNDGKRPELKTVFVDNLTPLMLEFEDYVEVTYGRDFITKEGNFDTISFYKRLNQEATDFFRLIYSLPCNVVASCHIAMVASEEIAANTTFMTAAKMGGVKKEWQPNLTGKVRFILAGMPDWVFFLKTEENAGQPTKYVAKLEADDSNVGVAKSRIQPFDKPSRIEIPKNTFYEFLNSAIEKKLTLK
jgi:hypothetical protein